MKNKELFDRTVAVLVNAYFTDTLNPYSTCGCAVGNLVAAGLGLKVLRDALAYQGLRWSNGASPSEVKWTLGRDSIGSEFANYKYYESDLAQIEIAATGYSREQIIHIESFFMYKKNYFDRVPHENNFDGLMAVIDYLMIVHEASEEEIKEAKELFIKI